MRTRTTAPLYDQVERSADSRHPRTPFLGSMHDRWWVGRFSFPILLSIIQHSFRVRGRSPRASESPLDLSINTGLLARSFLSRTPGEGDRKSRANPPIYQVYVCLSMTSFPRVYGRLIAGEAFIASELCVTRDFNGTLG